MTTTQSSSPVTSELVPDPVELNKYILRAFNVFDPLVAVDPTQILNHLTVNPLTNGEVPTDLLTTQLDLEIFKSTYLENYSYEETKTKLATSYGISGSCAFFSGSVQVDSDKELSRTASFFNASNTALILKGAKYFTARSEPDKILALLKPQLVTQLRGINSINLAAQFTNNYGTHLITQINLGGKCFVSAQAETYSSAEKVAVAVQVSLSYANVASVHTLANSISKAESLRDQYNISQNIITSGGSANMAAKIDPHEPLTFEAWADSCTPETIIGIGESKEFWELLEEHSDARKFLKKYIDLTVLSQSINSPSVFCIDAAVVPNGESTAQILPPENYKTISGGACLSLPCRSSFLQSSYPYRSGALTGWNVRSHDLLDPSEPGVTLTAYVTAVYDPGNLLNVEFTSLVSDNHGVGVAIATVPIPAGYILTGGGAAIDHTPDSAPKFLNSIHPWKVQADDQNYNLYIAQACDYQNPSVDTYLTGYSVAIHSEDLEIKQFVNPTQFVFHPIGNERSHLPHGYRLAGGGVYMTYTGLEGEGNFLQQSFPLNSTSWQEHNTCFDFASTDVRIQAFAIGLKSNVKL